MTVSHDCTHMYFAQIFKGHASCVKVFFYVEDCHLLLACIILGTLVLPPLCAALTLEGHMENRQSSHHHIDRSTPQKHP